MKKIRCFIVALSFLPVAGLTAQPFLADLTAQPWHGTGVLMGSPAKFEMNWQWVLDEKFLQLTFRHTRETGGDAVVFSAHGYYKPVNDSMLTGVWFDSRGVSLPVEGRLGEKELSVDWGSDDTERGRTIYEMESSCEIRVTDFVYRGGSYVKFGEANYKTPPCID